MNRNKKIGKNIILSLIIFFLMLFTFAVLESATANTIPDHEGYIVVLEDNSNVNIDSTEINEIVKDKVYQAESLQNIRNEIPAKDIDYIEPNYKMVLCEEYTPNDERYFESKWIHDIINIQKVWGRGYFGNFSNSSDAPVVAVIDSGIVGTGNNGILIKHEDLKYDNILKGENFTSANSFDTNDGFGHGTFVSGIIAANIDNTIGIVGDMPNVKIRPYRAYDNNGMGNVSTEIQCIYAAIRDGVDVINISAGRKSYSTAEESAINSAVEHGIIVCASSGNDYGNVEKYPAGLKGVVSVASIDKSEIKSLFSTYNSEVDCTAPGENILSLSNSGKSAYKTDSGTSFSCPQVTALAAMCKSIDPSIDHDRFMELIKSTSRDIGNPGYDNNNGWGVADYGNMLDALVPEDNSIWSADITGISAEADYTGETITFENLKITMPGGQELSAGSDYTVTYFNNIDKMMGMLTIQGIGSYTGRINKYFKINGAPEKEDTDEEGESTGGGGGGGSYSPDIDETAESADSEIVEPEPTPAIKLLAPTIKKLIAGRKSFTIKWKKVADADGYRLQYSTTKTFKKGTRKTLTISKNKTYYKIKKLKPHKRYYVRMRCYKVVDSKKRNSGWSDIVRIIVKR